MVKLLMTLLVFAISTIAQEDACPVVPPTACAVVRRPRGQARLRCGVNGKARHPTLLRKACVASTFEDCRQVCLTKKACHSFSFATDQFMAGTCSLYTGSVVAQGFHADNSSLTRFYNRHCYRFNCARTDCPSQTFNLQVTSNQSPYFKYLIQRVSTVLKFTTDITKAATFSLNSNCQMAMQDRIGSDGQNNRTNPDVVNGPLYFYSNATTYSKRFSIPKCSINTGSFRLSCDYSAVGGSSNASFYSCNGVVSLGSFPGSPPCTAKDGPIALTAFSFGSIPS